MSEIIILQWLPASWKSTWAKKYLRNNPNAIRFNKDDARLQHFNKRFSKRKEEMILKFEEVNLHIALKNWRDVVVDNTHFNEIHIHRINWIAEQYDDVDVRIKFFDAWPITCKHRNKLRNNVVPDYAIDNIISKIPKEDYPFKEYSLDIYKPDETKPKAIIVDIDWTIAKMTTRDPYTYNEELMTDVPRREIINIVNMYRDNWYKILIFTWRKEEWDVWTKLRLKEHNVDFDVFECRKELDDRADTIIKKEFFNKYKDNYNIELCIDDRDWVVAMYRAMWLTVLQVWYWNF